MMSRIAKTGGALGVAFAVAAASPPAAPAAPDPAGCTEQIAYDPSIPTFTQVAAAAGNFSTNNGQSTTTLGGFQTGTSNRHPTADLYAYQQAVADATAGNTRVRVVVKTIGPTYGGRQFKYSIVGTPEHVASVEQDAAFWRGVRDGSISRDQALARLDTDAPPAFGWITATPHGNEPAAGESTMRILYELAARTDCANQRRLADMTYFVNPARNPDGRDNNSRLTAFAFDPNRDVAFQTQDVNAVALDDANRYPALYFIDAHQQTSGYFFPPNEDPVLHEISDFALDTIQNTIGTALQQRFNDQGLAYRNYNAYDLFSNQYGDSGPSLFMGAAGMTFEKGTTENYGKQVYDHYLAIDETINVVARDKERLTRGWVAQWQEAADQGAACKLQENKLVSPLHTPPSGEIAQQPAYDICGYYLKAGQHAGDVARIVDLLRGRDVKVYRLTAPVAVSNSRDFGESADKSQTLPAGTLWIPAGQTMKHWLHSTMEEDPFIPYPYFYDVVNWSFPELYYLGGGGWLKTPIGSPPMTQLTGATDLGGLTGPTGGNVLAIPTDSSKALGLLTQLLNGGATVYRGAEAFDAGGVRFPTGTALVDGSTLGGMDVEAMSSAMQTPVYSLADYPANVVRYKLKQPKIALYTGGATAPPNPVFNAPPGNHCTTASYCEMVFALARQLNVPVSRLAQFTSTDLAAGNLISQGFTAIVVPGSTIPAGPGSVALQAFVNQGGNYVGYNNGGTTSARTAGLTTLNTTPTTQGGQSVPPFNARCPDNNDPTAPGSLTTPGTAFNAEYDTSNPAAWGFDEGGYIFRDTSGASVFDPATVPASAVAAKYPNALRAFGYQCNALAPGSLPGRPYVVGQGFGAGHVTIIGSNAFFRGWTAGAQRLAMNGVLWPPNQPYYTLPRRQADSDAGVALSKRALRKWHKVKNRPVRPSRNLAADASVTVSAKRAARLRKAVRKAELPRAVAARVSYRRHGRFVRMTIRGAASFARSHPGDPKLKVVWTRGDLEMRPEWAWRLIRQMTRLRVKPAYDEI